MLDWRKIRDEKDKYQAYLCSREWSVVKQKVLERSGGLCERCKVNPHESTHHLTYARKYNERPEDLQGICNKCHKFIHGKSDFDPAIRPPVVNGKVVETFYLAGKITGTTWRDQIVPGWSEENHSFNYYKAVLEPRYDGVLGWGPVQVDAPGRSPAISYLGPWWSDSTGMWGGHAIATRMGSPHASVDEESGRFSLDHKGRSRFSVRVCVEDAIRQSDLIFAWIDTADCLGTLFEIGLAAGLKKNVVFASPVHFDTSEFWLSRYFSHYCVVAPSPRAAWDAFWKRDDIIAEKIYPYGPEFTETIFAGKEEAHA